MGGCRTTTTTRPGGTHTKEVRRSGYRGSGVVVVWYAEMDVRHSTAQPIPYSIAHRQGRGTKSVWEGTRREREPCAGREIGGHTRARALKGRGVVGSPLRTTSGGPPATRLQINNHPPTTRPLDACKTRRPIGLRHGPSVSCLPACTIICPIPHGDPTHSRFASGRAQTITAHRTRAGGQSTRPCRRPPPPPLPPRACAAVLSVCPGPVRDERTEMERIAGYPVTDTRSEQVGNQNRRQLGSASEGKRARHERRGG